MDDIKNYISHSIELKQAIYNNNHLLLKIYQAGQLAISTLKRKGKIIIAGNGGSAADAMHMAAEFNVKFYSARQALAAVALGTNTCVLTAISNDFDYEYSFSRELEAIGYENDVLIAISTSGHSKNILSLIDSAKKKNIPIIFITSEMLGEMYLKKVDIPICVPSHDTPIIQESHLMIEHLICYEVEKEMQNYRLS